MSNLQTRRVTQREAVVEVYHGIQVADPYRWLEDDTCPEVQAWTKEQNGDFEAYINSFDIRSDIKSRLSSLMNYAKTGVPTVVKGVYYTWRNDGLQNQHVLYRSSNPSELGEVIFDPNLLSDDGTVAVTSKEFSPNGKCLAYGLSKSGSDWQTMHVLDLETLENLPDILCDLKFTSL